MTEYRITRLADYDLEGIWDYTVQEWSLDQAEKYVRELPVLKQSLTSV